MNIATQLRNIIADEFGVDAGIITPQARFVDDLGVDSLDSIELTMRVEEAFEIEIPDEDASQLTTVGQAQKYLEAKLEGAPLSHGDITEDGSGRAFIQYWKGWGDPKVVTQQEPLDFSSSSQLRRVHPGDTLWLVSLDSSSHLFLIGRIVVGEVVDYKEAVRRFSDVWESPYIAVAKAGTAEPPRYINLMPIAPQLRFQSQNFKDQLEIVEGKISGRQLQTMRLLTEDAATLLEQQWETTDSSEELPDASQLENEISHGAGFGTPEKNKEVERAAVALDTSSYREQGWQVVSVEAKQCGYDLLCTKGRQAEHVEVKGISGSKPAFIITHNEVKQAEKDPHFVLCVVTRALHEAPQLHRFTGQEFLTKFHLQELAFRASLR